MAYQSKFTGQEVDELLQRVQDQKDDPASILDSVTGDDILGKITGQQIIDKINSVSGNITFTKFLDCQGGAGKEEG